MHLSISSTTGFLITSFLLSTSSTTAGRASYLRNRKGGNQVYWQTEQYDHSRENSIHVLPESIPQTPIETPKSYGDDGSGRMLSFWSSLMNFIKCPPGFHDDNNPHCHPDHHKGGHGGGSHGGGGGGGGGGGNPGCGGDDDSCGCGGDDDGCNDDDNNYVSNDDDDRSGCGDDDNCVVGDDGEYDRNFDDDDWFSTPPPTIFEDNISNDHRCWWCGRGQRNSSGANDTGTSSSYGRSFAFGAIGMAGTAAVLSVFIRKRHQAVTAPSKSDNHLLSGAVKKRKKKFEKAVNGNTNTTLSPSTGGDSLLGDGTVPVGKRKNKFFKWLSGKQTGKMSPGAEGTDTPGSHYVKA